MVAQQEAQPAAVPAAEQRKLEAERKRELVRIEKENKAIQAKIKDAADDVGGILNNRVAGPFVAARKGLNDDLKKIQAVLEGMKNQDRAVVEDMTPKLYSAFSGVYETLDDIIERNQVKGAQPVKPPARRGKHGGNPQVHNAVQPQMSPKEIAVQTKTELLSIERGLNATPGLENYAARNFVPKTPTHASKHVLFVVDDMMNNNAGFMKDHPAMQTAMAQIKTVAREMVDTQGKPVSDKALQFHKEVQDALDKFDKIASPDNDRALDGEQNTAKRLKKNLTDMQDKVNRVHGLQKVALIGLPDDLRAFPRLAVADVTDSMAQTVGIGGSLITGGRAA